MYWVPIGYLSRKGLKHKKCFSVSIVIIMVFPPATRLIECDIQMDVHEKWRGFVDGGNGCLYGIPDDARRVVEFKVEDKSIKEIGPDLGYYRMKYGNGIKPNNDSIYCIF